MRPRPDGRSPERLIEQHATTRGTHWFPELGPEPKAVVRAMSVRPSCSLYLVRLTGSGAARAAVAKVRKPTSTSGQGAARSSRPRLRTVATTGDELTRLEFEGLSTIWEQLGTDDPAGRALRPLEHVPAHTSLVMEHVGLPTLREGLLAESRLLPFSQRRVVPPPVAWRNAGAWLRAYHDRYPPGSKPARQERAEDVAERFGAYGGFLTDLLGRTSVGDMAQRGAELAVVHLKDRLPLAVGHGDYVARNMFVDGSGRIMVFDPMPRWRMPRYEDICRFLVGMRVSGLQLHSYGAAYADRTLQVREDWFLSGYYGDEPVPWPQLRCYQLLVLLDKWSALLESASVGRSWRSHARVTGPATRYLTSEAARLLGLASRA